MAKMRIHPDVSLIWIVILDNFTFFLKIMFFVDLNKNLQNPGKGLLSDYLFLMNSHVHTILMYCKQL